MGNKEHVTYPPFWVTFLSESFVYFIAEEEEIMFTAVLRCATGEGKGHDILKEEETEILCCYICNPERIHKWSIA